MGNIVHRFEDHLDLTGHRIGNLGEPTSATEAATKAYVDARAGSVDAAAIATALGYTPANAAALSATALTSGAVPDARMPALTGDITSSAGAVATTLATVNSNVGTFGSATQSLTATVDAKGRITAISAQTLTLAVGSITGFATGIATWLAVSSSANLAAAITDETGSGALVFATSPTLVTPVLGVASATSINKVAITAPATSATLAIADGQTLTVSASATISGSPPSLSAANNWTAAQTNLQSIAATSTDGWVLSNTTAAAAGAQQWSPRLRLSGKGWKTDATAASQAVDWIIENQPVQGAANPTTALSFSAQVSAGGYNQKLRIDSTGGTSAIVSAYGNGSGNIPLLSVYYDSGATEQIRLDSYGTISLTGSLRGGTAASGGGNFVINDSGQFLTKSAGSYGFTNGTASGGTYDTLLTRSAAATLQQGAANAASPVAQTLQAQGSRAGTDSNVGGASYSIGSGVGTGTGTVSVLNLQSPVAVGSGTGAQTQTTGFAIKNGTGVLTSYTVATLPSASTSGAGATAFVTDASTTLVLGLGGTVTGGGANKVPVFSDGTNWIYG